MNYLRSIKHVCFCALILTSILSFHLTDSLLEFLNSLNSFFLLALSKYIFKDDIKRHCTAYFLLLILFQFSHIKFRFPFLFRSNRKHRHRGKEIPSLLLPETICISGFTFINIHLFQEYFFSGQIFKKGNVP